MNIKSLQIQYLNSIALDMARGELDFKEAQENLIMLDEMIQEQPFHRCPCGHEMKTPPESRGENELGQWFDCPRCQSTFLKAGRK